MPRRGKGYKEASAKVERQKLHTVDEAVVLLKETTYAKFDETVDLALRLGVNPKYSDQMVRGACLLPHGTGKSARVLVFAKGDKALEAKAAGADIVGDDELIEKIQTEEFLDFDKTIATPDMMGKVGRLGKVLGRRGLMPNPKLGTVTFDVAQAVREAKGGRVEFKVEKAGILHTIIGRKSFQASQLKENLLALMDTVMKLKPSGAKGTYVRSITISATMSPGIKIDPNEMLSMGRK
ncbi:MAG: 50S ribosomal protein L1 [Deltaproteobacteria bacterium]|nr:50S ribosomal protein L1 [Deltaproteobacteria bacterium]